MRALALAVAIAAGSSIVQAADRPVDWRATALSDIAAARTILLDNSPGGVPGVDPPFRRTIDRAADLASRDARRATTIEGYHFALERFANTFQDNHLWVDFNDPLPVRWPGFLPGWRGGRLEVATTSDPNAFPLHSVLIGCDGQGAGTMADRVLTAYAGRWSVPSSRRHYAPYLMADRGDPFAPRPRVCAFRGAGHIFTRRLDWRPLDAAEFRTRLAVAQHVITHPLAGVRMVADGGYWVSIPTLNALDPAAIAGLETLMKEIEDKGPAIRAAPYFVIDLRGETGGNTFVALRVLNAIWGEGAVAAVRPHALKAQWRASPGNIAYLSQVEPVLKRLFGDQSLAYTGLKRILDGFRASAAARRDIFVDGDEYSILDAWATGPRHAVAAKPFLFTDGGCVSSCLNLVDMILKLPGVVQIGDETASDTFYLENRPNPLPSGHAALEFPIKRYQNRERGLNRSYAPRYAWNGDMDDNAGIERWVSGLARR